MCARRAHKNKNSTEKEERIIVYECFMASCAIHKYFTSGMGWRNGGRMRASHFHIAVHTIPADVADKSEVRDD